MELADDNGLSDDEQQIVRLCTDECVSVEEAARTLGLSRQRVREVLQRSTGLSGRELTQHLQKLQYLKRDTDTESAAEELREQISALVRERRSRQEAVPLLAAQHPDLSRVQIERAIDRLGVTFPSAGPAPVSDDVLVASLAFAIGYSRGRDDGQTDGASTPAALESELRQVLERSGLDGPSIEEALRRTRQGFTLVRDDPTAELSQRDYDRARASFMTAHGLSGERGQLVWPISKQTIISRLGGWPAALSRLGLGGADTADTADTVRTVDPDRTSHKFTREELERAIADFKDHSWARGGTCAIREYNAWHKLEIGNDVPRPSSGVLRNVYGSWSQALDADGRTRTRPLRVDGWQPTSDARTSAATSTLIRASEARIAKIETRLDQEERSGTSDEERRRLLQELSEEHAKISSLQREEERWQEDVTRGKRQFLINAGLAVAAGFMPLVIWILDRLFA